MSDSTRVENREAQMDCPLSGSAAETLRAVIDRLIPADEDSPGGVDAGVLSYLLRQLATEGILSEYAAEYERGLETLDRLARVTFNGAFTILPAARQDATLSTFEASEPRFFRRLTEHAHEGFYISPAGLEMAGFRVTG